MDLRAVLRFAESRGFGWLFIGLGEKCGRGGERDGQGLLYDLRGGGTRTARWVKDPERTKCANILEMLYCRSGGQDGDWRSARLPPHNNIHPSLSIPNPLTPRMPLSSTQAWLRENARFYSNPTPVYAHADALLARFPPIRPKTDVYSSAIAPSLSLSDHCSPSSPQLTTTGEPSCSSVFMALSPSRTGRPPTTFPSRSGSPETIQGNTPSHTS